MVCDTTAFAFAKAIPLASLPTAVRTAMMIATAPRHGREREAVVSAEMRGDAGLKRRVHRRQQVTELINETRKRPSRGVRRQLVQMHRHHDPMHPAR